MLSKAFNSLIINACELSVPAIQLNDICDNRTLTIKKATETLPTSLWTDRSVCLGTEAGQENSLPLGMYFSVPVGQLYLVKLLRLT